jgi:hypothetical protein
MNDFNTTTFVNPMLNQSPVAQWSMVATLNQPTLDVIRQIIREEISAALERRDQRGLDNLMADISEPVDEQEEMAAVLATMTADEWETLVQRVKARKATE